MNEIIIWLYIINLSLIILHEMDSTYWKEWEMFRLPGGEGGFLLIHLPLWIAALYGLVLLREGTAGGRVFSLVIGAAGMAGFFIHTYFLRKGRPEFNTPASRGILWAMLLVSLILVVLTIVSY